MNKIDNVTLSAFSVVIASWCGEAALRRCLESLLPQAHDAEVVVAFRDIFDPTIFAGDRFKDVRFVRASADADVFQLRSLGVRETHGHAIALIEDHSIVSPDWMQTLVRARAAGVLIGGGPIDNDAESTAYDWALYFSEYARFMPPVPVGDAAIVSGANIFYDRATLWSCYSIWESCFYETDVNGALLAAGYKIDMLPDTLVTSRLRMDLAEAMAHLFRGGIHFGNFRKAHSHPLVRWLWVITSPAVPVVMLLRIARVLATRRPDRLTELIRSFPYMLLLVLAWSLGEAAGYFTRHVDLPRSTREVN